MSALDELAEDPEFEEFQRLALGFFAEAEDPEAAAEAFYNGEFDDGVENLGRTEDETVRDLSAIRDASVALVEHHPELVAQLIAEMENGGDDDDNEADSETGNE